VKKNKVWFDMIPHPLLALQHDHGFSLVWTLSAPYPQLLGLQQFPAVHLD